MTVSGSVMRRAGALAGVAALLLVLSGCSSDPTLTADQVKASHLTGDQLADLGGNSVDATIPDYTAADLVAVAGSPPVVDPESCRQYVQSIAVPGQVILPSQDADSTDPVVVAPHLDVGQGFIEQAVRVLPDSATATKLVTALRALVASCATFDYGSKTDVNRFVTVELGDLPFAGDGFVSTLTVKGTQVVVETDEIFVMRVGNVVATVRGTVGETQRFAQAVSDNLHAAG